MTANPDDDLLWRPLREAIGLTEEQWGNLTNLVALHMVLDRLLSLRILVMMYSTGWVEQGAVDELLSIVAEIPFGRRIEMARAADLLPADTIADLKEVNRARNSLLHFKPKFKEDFKEVAEINSMEALRRLAQHGLRGFDALMKELLPLFEAAQKADQA